MIKVERLKKNYMRQTQSFFTHVKTWRLLASVTLLLGLLLGLTLLAHSASASPLPTHPAGVEKHADHRADPPGAPGAQTLQNWRGTPFAYLFNTKAQVIPVNGAVRFDTFPPFGGALMGFIFTKNGELVTHQPGIYKVTFSVTNNASNVFALAVNNVPVQGTAYLSNSTLANLGSQNNGQAIIRLNAWDRLTLQNRSGGPVALAPLFNNGQPGTPATVNASLLVEQLG